jgi:hypothetical protein
MARAALGTGTGAGSLSSSSSSSPAMTTPRLGGEGGGEGGEGSEGDDEGGGGEVGGEGGGGEVGGEGGALTGPTSAGALALAAPSTSIGASSTVAEAAALAASSAAAAAAASGAREAPEGTCNRRPSGGRPRSKKRICDCHAHAQRSGIGATRSHSARSTCGVVASKLGMSSGVAKTAATKSGNSRPSRALVRAKLRR